MSPRNKTQAFLTKYSMNFDVFIYFTISLERMVLDKQQILNIYGFSDPKSTI